MKKYDENGGVISEINYLNGKILKKGNGFGDKSFDLDDNKYSIFSYLEKIDE